ncbi:MAG: hypothetical protein HXY20_00240 [Acidobacteria bacterium]|nr:hypothetical protein [Acidobacteriota bacterium]
MADRRARPVFPPLFSTYRRRRNSGRRKTDPPGYVDVYDAGTWGVALSILLLSMVDALLTGFQIRRGLVREANPLMNMVLVHCGHYSFISLKLALTAMPLAILVLHREWGVARYAARICLWAYLFLTCYHLYLALSLPR